MCRTIIFHFNSSSPTSFTRWIFNHFQCWEIMVICFDCEDKWLIIERHYFYTDISIVWNRKRDL